MGRQDFETETLISVGGFFDQPTHSLRADGFDASEDGTGRGTPLVPVGIAQTITAAMYRGGGATAGNNPGITNAVVSGLKVRRLTPRECERLQGFPDDYTLVERNGKPMADGPRYKMLGNSMAVPVVRWIGERIQQVEDMNRGVRNAA